MLCPTTATRAAVLALAPTRELRNALERYRRAPRVLDASLHAMTVGWLDELCALLGNDYGVKEHFDAVVAHDALFEKALDVSKVQRAAATGTAAGTAASTSRHEATRRVMDALALLLTALSKCQTDMLAVPCEVHTKLADTACQEAQCIERRGATSETRLFVEVEADDLESPLADLVLRELKPTSAPCVHGNLDTFRQLLHDQLIVCVKRDTARGDQARVDAPQVLDLDKSGHARFCFYLVAIIGVDEPAANGDARFEVSVASDSLLKRARREVLCYKADGLVRYATDTPTGAYNHVLRIARNAVLLVYERAEPVGRACRAVRDPPAPAAAVPHGGAPPQP